jgi:hypothetical protein
MRQPGFSGRGENCGWYETSPGKDDVSAEQKNETTSDWASHPDLAGRCSAPSSRAAKPGTDALESWRLSAPRPGWPGSTIAQVSDRVRVVYDPGKFGKRLAGRFLSRLWAKDRLRAAKKAVGSLLPPLPRDGTLRRQNEELPGTGGTKAAGAVQRDTSEPSHGWGPHLEI